jgi:hypothetical protein
MPLSQDPFRIAISITRGTNRGRALELMSNGLVIVHQTYESALNALERFEDAAAAVLNADVDKGLVFGVACILNQMEGKVEYSKVLKSQ